MRVCLSENGHSKEFKPLKELAVSFAQMSDSPFGKNYNFIGFNSNDKISLLLERFDESEELEFYFFKNILYIIIESEPVFYIIEIGDEDLADLSNQIRKNKKILIAIMSVNKIEQMFLFNIIM